MKKSKKENFSTGQLPFRLTNDYLFRAVFQSRPKALEGLCRALLHLSPEDTISISVHNPIELGKEITAKEFILDLAVLINDYLLLNLEMQVCDESNWTDRSLSYVCRSFDNLNQGEKYSTVLPVTQVGFLSFSLFPEHPEFYATYQLMNTKSHYIYSDKFRISVVNLKQIELATEEDKKYGIDRWARLLTATTWEEIEMLAQNNEYLQETVSGVRQLTAEEQIRQQCQAREDFLYWERIRKIQTERLQTQLADAQAELANKETELTSKDAEIANKDAEIANKDAEIASKDAEIARLRALIENK